MICTATETNLQVHQTLEIPISRDEVTNRGSKIKLINIKDTLSSCKEPNIAVIANTTFLTIRMIRIGLLLGRMRGSTTLKNVKDILIVIESICILSHN